MTWPCTNNPGAWGATAGRADVETAQAGCAVCPRDLDECLTEFAALITVPAATDGLVVAGLHGRALRGAIRQIRDRRRAA